MKISKDKALKLFDTRIITILCFLALISILAGYFIPKVYSRTSIKNEESPSPQRIKVVALGRLEPEGEIISVTGQLGERIARLEVSEGSLVKTGQIIAFTEIYNERLQERNLAASQLAEVRLQRTIIRSPGNGKILKIFAYPGEAISQEGILKLGNTKTMYAVAEVYETDVSLIKLGQQATIISPAFHQPLTGKVSEIGRLVFKNNIIGDDPTAKSDARVVEVKIRLVESKLASNFSQLQVDVAIDLTSPGVQQNDSP